MKLCIEKNMYRKFQTDTQITRRLPGNEFLYTRHHRYKCLLFNESVGQIEVHVHANQTH